MTDHYRTRRTPPRACGLRLRVEELERRDAPAALFSEFTLPTGSQPTAIAAGPDGNLWFTETGANKVGRLTIAGNLTEFPVGSLPTGITAGPDGNVWYTLAGTGAAGNK